MKAYYWVTEKEKEIFYVPNVLVSVFNDKKTKHYYQPNFLESINLSIINNQFNLDRLKENSIFFYSCNINPKLVQRFIMSCNRYSRNKSKKNIFRLEDIAEKICERIFDSYESVYPKILNDEIECIENNDLSYEDKNNDGYFEDYEDYIDDWWIRGEEPPEYQ
jgi:hypothetical protein